MKKTIYFLILSLVVVVGVVVTKSEIKKESKASSKPIVVAEKKSDIEEKKKWEASLDGIEYKKWEVSPEGKKVYDSHQKIKKYLTSYAAMDAVVTSVTFKRKNAAASGPKWLIVAIDGEEYMMQFSRNDFQQLNTLKVYDKITVKSRSAGYSSQHPYLIVTADYIGQNNKTLYKRDWSKNKGC